MWSVEVRNAVLAVVVATVIVYHVFKFVRAALWEPLRLRRIMTKQGVRGPPFKFLLGQYTDMVKFAESFPETLDMDDFANLSPTVSPQYAMYFPKYGNMFLYWWGTMTKLVVRDPEILKELLITNHNSLERVELENMLIQQVIGPGLMNQEGEKWSSVRRMINPSFNQHTVKTMVEAMVQGATSELQIWERKVSEARGEVEIDVELGLHKISGRIFSRVAFSDDFEIGEQILHFQRLLADEAMHMYQTTGFWLIPGYRNLPIQGNRMMNLYSSKVDALLHDVINGRLQALRKGVMSEQGNHDILGRTLASATDGWDESAQEFNMASVRNYFKALYFAGIDTTSNVLNFAMLMLALHPEWQERARAEVSENLGEEQSWSSSAVSRLKVVGMIWNEAMRLFPPIISVTRVATKDLQLSKGLFVPKGMTIECAVTAIHQDKVYWGADVGEFNPGRFANGVSEACSHPQAFIPFGAGPRNCLGSNLANMEAKIVLAMVLRRFQLLPSLKYKHHPTLILMQTPKFGMHIILKAL